MRPQSRHEGFQRCDIPDGLFAEHVGPLYVRRDERGVLFGFEAAPHHGNERQGVHGGMLMTLADQVLGLTVLEAIGWGPAATVSLNCNFVSSAVPGDWIEGRAEVVRVTRSLVFVRGTLSTRDAVVLTADGLWKILDGKPKAIDDDEEGPC